MKYKEKTAEGTEKLHPADSFLRSDSIPSVWCSGCGIGTAVSTFIQTVEKLKIDMDKICVVSGVGCTGKVSECLKCNFSQMKNSNAIQCAATFKFKNPDHKVVVFLNDADFMVSEQNDFIVAGEKNIGLLVIYINNFLYHILIDHRASRKTLFIGTPAENNVGSPFNIPHLAKSYGAEYVARWTPLHVRRLMYSMTDVLQKSGFSVIEVIAPCLMYYASNGIIGKSFDRMKFFYDNSIIKHNEPSENLDLRTRNKIIVGKFIDTMKR